MRILIAPDSFKGTISASAAAEKLAVSIESALTARGITPHIVACPLADGGEGTSEVFAGERITLPTTDANGRLIEATYTYDHDATTAYIDVAAASGLPAVNDSPRPLTADTFGTGVLIADAQTRGATRIVMGLGGTATTDGGTGILVALGANPLDDTGRQLSPGGAALTRLSSFDTAQLNIGAAAVEWVLLADVTNPAAGDTGAAATFGPQKGATASDVAALDAGITRLCHVCGIDPATPGFGAAGAIPVGITWLSHLIHGSYSHVHLLPGAKVVADSLDLAHHIDTADVVITGEGRFDSQSTHGKVVGEVLERVGATPSFVVAGGFEINPPDGVHAITLIDAPIDRQLHQAGLDIAAILSDLHSD